MSEMGSITSQRGLLSALALAPVVMASPWDAAISALPYYHEAVALRRTRAGRSDSRFRYHNDESFFGIEQDVALEPHDWLYQIGTVLQLGLSSHLLDVGFADAWCSRHVGLDIVRSLAYAYATGFGFEMAEFDQLAAFISPYKKWRWPGPGELTDRVPFSLHDNRTTARALLDHVHRVTGHPRPQGWAARRD